MKKSIRFLITGSVQPTFYNQFIKNHADKLGVKGYIRHKDDGKIEIFIEGNTDAIIKMAPLCKRGPQHSVIRDIEERLESFQDFKNFKILGI